MDSPDRYLLSEEEHDLIFQQEIIPDVFKNVKSQNTPIAAIFGGQPGSGKSAAIDLSVKKFIANGGCVLIIGDELRDYHPAYRELLKQSDKLAAFYTDRDSGRWIEKAITHAKELKCNLVIEGTMRVPEKVADTMKSLKNMGYIVEAHALAVNEKLSWQGILQRYENQRADRGFGRMTTQEAHQAGYNGMLNTLDLIEKENLADKIIIYKRGAEIIYENELQNGKWLNKPLAKLAVENERNRSWTLPERIAYAKSFDTLIELIKKPEREATETEINTIITLQKEAYAQISATEKITA